MVFRLPKLSAPGSRSLRRKPNEPLFHVLVFAIHPPPVPTVTLSLISHTNVGKTTLARTLLRQDVGEVRDAPHVTAENTVFTMIEAQGHRLQLWDTPGFGDTGRLLKRLRRESNTVLWFLSQAWDRFREKALWHSQQALKNVREEADVVLYLVNAAETPGGAAYVEQEMEILGWLKKPVLVLLNQTGPARAIADELAEVEAWRSEMKRFAIVREVLPLDAFARCWVQEDHLMDVVAQVVPEEKQACFEMLQRAWHRRHMEVFDDSMRSLAELLTASVLDGVEVKRSGVWQSTVKLLVDKVSTALGMEARAMDSELAVARDTMVKALATRMEEATNKLISVHGLSGRSGQRLLDVSQEHFQTPQRVSESIWGAMGGVATGAMTGLWADLHAGGFTLGGGMIAGAVAGAVGGYALAHGFNLVRGDDSRVHWSREHFREQVRLAMLCYLAVAHFGRGRGDYEDVSVPPIWDETVSATITHKQSAWDHVWSLAVKQNAMPEDVHREMIRQLRDTAVATLRRLYPAAKIQI